MTEFSPISRKNLPKYLYAKTDSVKATKDKDPTSAVVQRLKRGDRVHVLDQSGSRYLVKWTTGQTGWVSKIRLSGQQPPDELKGLTDMAKLNGQTSPTVKESMSGGSIRG